MKLAIFLTFALVFHVFAETNAQKITLNVKNAPLREVMQEIQKQQGYSFLFRGDEIADMRVNVQLKEVDFADAMRTILERRRLAWSLDEGIITIVRMSSRPNDRSKLILQRGITGRVSDEHGTPLEGVSVTVKGTEIVTTTTNNGSYKISVQGENQTLQFSMLGYGGVEEAINGREVINVELQPTISDLSEVVVVGYGTVKREDLTGAVGSVDINSLRKAPVASFDEALAGRVAGVQVSSNDGQPGSLPNIVIRGNSSITQDNSPLYVVDGFPIEDNENSAINPTDIESIEVLKDASATAIYGARGANGVIIITTKQGKGKAQISYDAFLGQNESVKTMEVLSPYEFVKYQSELFPDRASYVYFGDGMTLEEYRKKPGIDWQNELLRKAVFHNHSIAVRGADDKTSYSLSGSTTQQDGIIINSGFKRLQGRAVFSRQVSSRLKVRANVNYAATSSHGTPIADYGGANSKLSLLGSAWGYRPTTQGEDQDLIDVNLDPDIDAIEDYRYNPIKSARNEEHWNGRNSLSANGYVQYRLNQYLVFKASGGYRSSVFENQAFFSSNTRRGDRNTPQGTNGPNGRVRRTDVTSVLTENTLTYKRIIGERHHLDLLGGFTAQKRNYWQSGFSATAVPNESLGISGLDEGTLTDITSIKSVSTLASFLTRANYRYSNRYYLTLSLRGDGSSKFNPDNRWSYFPSAAIAYRFINERYIKRNLPFLSDGKLRVSYGIIGNNRVSDFAYLSTVAVERSAGYSFGNTFYPGADLAALGNYNLRWETTSMLNLGVDIGFWANRLSLTADYYYNETYDLLLNAQMAGSTGFTSAFQNIGRVSNSGLEFTLNTQLVDRQSFQWQSSFNISFNKNRIVALQPNQNHLLSPVRWDASAYRLAPVYIAEVGAPIGMFYGYVFDGLYQEADFHRTANGGYVLRADVPNNQSARTSIQPGYVRYKDLNGDGEVNSLDQAVLGNPNPLHFGGFNNNFRYNNFDLNIFFQWSYGNSIYNANRLVFEGTTSSDFNQFATVANRWTLDNTDTNIPTINGQGQPMYSSRVIEDGSYLRLKTVQIGYSLPPSLLRLAKLQSLRFYVSGQNLMTWTSYSGLDPEVSTYNTALTPGFDYSPYPRARTYTFGLNLIL